MISFALDVVPHWSSGESSIMGTTIGFIGRQWTEFFCDRGRVKKWGSCHWVTIAWYRSWKSYKPLALTGRDLKKFRSPSPLKEIRVISEKFQPWQRSPRRLEEAYVNSKTFDLSQRNDSLSQSQRSPCWGNTSRRHKVWPVIKVEKMVALIKNQEAESQQLESQTVAKATPYRHLSRKEKQCWSLKDEVWVERPVSCIGIVLFFEEFHKCRSAWYFVSVRVCLSVCPYNKKSHEDFLPHKFPYESSWVLTTILKFLWSFFTYTGNIAHVFSAIANEFWGILRALAACYSAEGPNYHCLVCDLVWPAVQSVNSATSTSSFEFCLT